MSLLQDFSLELKPGQMTALVGVSGEGKSTCASLLQCFYEPQDGEIRLDDKPLNSYEHRFLHEKVIKATSELYFLQLTASLLYIVQNQLLQHSGAKLNQFHV